MQATFTIRKAHLVPDPEKKNFYSAFVPGWGVVSVQPDGTIGWRGEGTSGGYEEFYISGNRAVFPDVAGLSFAIPYEE